MMKYTIRQNLHIIVLYTLVTLRLCVIPCLANATIMNADRIPTERQITCSEWEKALDSEWPTEEQPIIRAKDDVGMNTDFLSVHKATKEEEEWTTE